jgi:serine protease Do
MRRASLALCLLIVPPAVASAQERPPLNVSNTGRLAIVQLHASSDRTRGWGEDRLAGTPIGPGTARDLRTGIAGCVIDVRATFEGGHTIERRRHDACASPHLTFRGPASASPQAAPEPQAPPQAQQAPAAPATPATTQGAPAALPPGKAAANDPSVTLVNRSGQPVYYVYAARARDNEWGGDRLGDATLSNNGRFRLALPRGACTWDLAVRYADRRVEEKTGLDLCARNEVIFDASTAFLPARPTSYGTGFFVSPQGHMLTNAHVAGECRTLAVHTDRGAMPARLVRQDKRNDLALIAVDVRGEVAHARFRALPVARVGDDVVVAGFPMQTVLQNGLNVTTGNLSAMAGFEGNSAQVQITAPVQPGNSGGPLLDMSGNVIGVVVSRLERGAQNVNFAVQGGVARLFLDGGGTPHAEASSATALRTADVADAARRFTFQIECR